MPGTIKKIAVGVTYTGAYIGGPLLKDTANAPFVSSQAVYHGRVTILSPGSPAEYRIVHWLDTKDVWLDAVPYAEATLDGDIGPTDTTIFLQDTGTLNLFPSGNFYICIDDELILVGTRTGNQLSNCARQQQGTFQASHSNGTMVYRLCQFAPASNVAYRINPWQVDASTVDGQVYVTTESGVETVSLQALFSQDGGGTFVKAVGVIVFAGTLSSFPANSLEPFKWNFPADNVAGPQDDVQIGFTCAVSCETSCQLGCQSGCQTGCESGGCQVNCESHCQSACQTGSCQTSCQAQCQTSCVSGCEGTSCQTGCQASCQSGCEVSCQATCEVTCQSLCQMSCETGCQAGACQVTCQSSCQLSCESSCQDTCQVSCQATCQTQTQSCKTTCETACQSGCQISCQSSCTTTCQKSCQGSSGCQTACQGSGGCQTACTTGCQSNCQGSGACQTSCQGGCTTSCTTGCQSACQSSGQSGPTTYVLSVGSNPNNPPIPVIGSSTGHGGTANYYLNVASGTSVNLQAPSSDPAGWSFMYWVLDGVEQGDGQKSITFNMSGNRTAVANYISTCDNCASGTTPLFADVIIDGGTAGAPYPGTYSLARVDTCKYQCNTSWGTLVLVMQGFQVNLTIYDTTGNENSGSWLWTDAPTNCMKTRVSSSVAFGTITVTPHF